MHPDRPLNQLVPRNAAERRQVPAHHRNLGLRRRIGERSASHHLADPLVPRGLGWLGKIHLLRDWTDGCIAVDNREIEEIWRLVDVGTVIEIRP